MGTVGQTLVKDLYNGRIVNQISCLECGRVSEREEDFLDMNVTVSGNESLASAFQVSTNLLPSPPLAQNRQTSYILNEYTILNEIRFLSKLVTL